MFHVTLNLVIVLDFRIFMFTEDCDNFIIVDVFKADDSLSANVIEELLNYSFQQSKFQVMSDQIIGRIDEMGVRLDELERNVGDLMQQSGIDSTQ